MGMLPTRLCRAPMQRHLSTAQASAAWTGARRASERRRCPLQPQLPLRRRPRPQRGPSLTWSPTLGGQYPNRRQGAQRRTTRAQRACSRTMPTVHGTLVGARGAGSAPCTESQSIAPLAMRRAWKGSSRLLPPLGREAGRRREATLPLLPTLAALRPGHQRTAPLRCGVPRCQHARSSMGWRSHLCTCCRHCW